MRKKIEAAFPGIERPLMYKGDFGIAAGMPLLDYFAAKALQGDWAAQNSGNNGIGCVLATTSDEELRKNAELYYRMADAMMFVRSNRDGEE